MPNGYEVETADGSLALRLQVRHDSAGWTLVGGGLRSIAAITWSFGTSSDLTVDVDAEAWLRDRVASMGCEPDATAAFITSRHLDRYVTCTAEADVGTVTAIATVGLSNALRAGDPAVRVPYGPGTINVAVRLPHCASSSALLEALGVAQEAKAAAILASGVASLVSGEPATGTGTDALVVAAPERLTDDAEPIRFAGKHTSIGAAVGQSVLEAVREGASVWLRERLSSAPVVLVGGGVRSGKSAFAETRTLAFASAVGDAPPIYVATAQAFDEEMKERIASHRTVRGEAFVTIEEPVLLAEVLLAAAHDRPPAILVDCLTLWLSNLLCLDLDDEAIDSKCCELVEVVRQLAVPIVLVSNEVGLGVVPDSTLGRRFRDAAGRLHQALSAASDEVYFAALGTVLRIKPGPVVSVERGACQRPKSTQ